MTGPAPHPLRTVFLCAAVAFVIAVLAISSGWGPPGSTYEGGRWVGFLLGLTALSALITGFLARRAKNAWSRTKIVVVYVVVLIVIPLFYLIGKLPPRQ